MGFALLSATIGAGLGIGLYFFNPGHAAPFGRSGDLLFHEAALLFIHEHTPLRTGPIAALSADNPKLRLVTIDEASLHEAQRDALGQYRVPRDVYARLVDRLQKAGARVIGFDLQFAADAENVAQDAQFAAALARLPSVLAYELVQDEDGPIAPRLAAATRTGFVPVQNEAGTVLAQPLADPRGRLSFAAAVAEAATGRRYLPIDADRARFGASVVPLDGAGRLLTAPFETDATTALERNAGAPSQWIEFARSIELVDALQLPFPELRAFFAGTTVVVGPTARGIGDFIDTPKGRMPTVFSTLRTVDQLMRDMYVRRVPTFVDLGCIVGMALLLGGVGMGLRLPTLAAFCAVAFAGYAFAALALFAYDFLWLDVVHVIVAMTGTVLVAGFSRGALERGVRERVTEIFAKHASTEVVHDLIDAPIAERADEFEGERVVVTIFYSDIRGFTRLAEELAPEAIYRQLNEYFEEMCAIVFKYGGYVDKFIGDALMAIFSAPSQRPDDPESAVRAALEQQRRLGELNADWSARGMPTLSVGIGINTGSVIMGQLGSRERVSFTVIGDAVNVAARLKGYAEGGQVVIGEATHAALRDPFEVEELASVVLKGKSMPMRVFRVIREESAATSVDAAESAAAPIPEASAAPRAARPDAAASDHPLLEAP